MVESRHDRAVETRELYEILLFALARDDNCPTLL